MLFGSMKIVFETKNDVVDYVSGGILPPPKTSFNNLMEKIKNPESVSTEKGYEFIIDESIIPNEERKVVEEILSRVYDNRVKRRNSGIKLVLTSIAGVTLYFLLRK